MLQPTETVTRPDPGLARGKWEAPAWAFWVGPRGGSAYVGRRAGRAAALLGVLRRDDRRHEGEHAQDPLRDAARRRASTSRSRSTAGSGRSATRSPSSTSRRSSSPCGLAFGNYVLRFLKWEFYLVAARDPRHPQARQLPHVPLGLRADRDAGQGGRGLQVARALRDARRPDDQDRAHRGRRARDRRDRHRRADRVRLARLLGRPALGGHRHRALVLALILIVRQREARRWR